MELHAHRAHQWVFGKAIKLRSHIVRRKIRITGDGVRPAGLLRYRLHPGHFILKAFGRPVRLYIDRGCNSVAGDVTQILRNCVVAPDRVVWTENSRLHGSGQPRQVVAPPDVVMRVDSGYHAYRILAERLSM